MTITTKHGNQYSEIEWAEMMENWAIEIANDEDAMEQEETIKSIATRRLIDEAGVNESKAYGIACHIYNEGCSAIQFTSIEKKAAVEKIDRWMTERAKNIW